MTILRNIAKALAAGITALWRAGVSVADDLLALILSPVRAILGGGSGTASALTFQPDVNPAELLSELREQPKRSESMRALDRDAMRSVMQYVKAMPSQRATIDLSAVARDVRATLLIMDEHELKALALAGDSAIRRFADGKGHRVHGVPDVGPQSASPAPETSTMEAMQERIRQRRGARAPSSFRQLRSDGRTAFRGSLGNFSEASGVPAVGSPLPFP